MGSALLQPVTCSSEGPVGTGAARRRRQTARAARPQEILENIVSNIPPGGLPCGVVKSEVNTCVNPASGVFVSKFGKSLIHTCRGRRADKVDSKRDIVAAKKLREYSSLARAVARGVAGVGWIGRIA